MISSDAKVAVIFSLSGAVAGVIGSKLAFTPSAIAGVAILYVLRRFAAKKFPDADIGQSGLMPYLTTWLAVLVILANV